MPIECAGWVLESVGDASAQSRLLDEGVFTADEVIVVIGNHRGNDGSPCGCALAL